MPPDSRLLAVDLDGTLIRQDGVVDDRDREAIASIRARGVKVVVATGRLYPGSSEVMDSLGLEGTQICSDGAHLVSHPSGDDVLCHGLGESRSEVRGLLAETGLSAFLTVGVRILLDAESLGLRRFVDHITPHIDQVPDVYAPSLWGDGQGPSAVVALGARDVVVRVEPQLRRLDVDVLRYDVPGPYEMSSLTIRPHAATKGSGLEAVAAESGLGLEHCVAVGDWLNDISMLECAGRSFAMGHAPSSVKEAAKQVLATQGGEGGAIAELVQIVWGY